MKNRNHLISKPVQNQKKSPVSSKAVLQAKAGILLADWALHESEVKFRRLFEAAQDGILLLDANTGQITDVNPFLEKMLGYSREEFLSKKLWEIGLFKDVLFSKTAFRELKRTGNIRYEDLPLETKDGKPCNVEFVSNVYPVNGRNIIQCDIRDITDRKQIETALKGSEEKFRQLFDNMGNCVAVYEAVADGEDFIIKDFNKAAERVEKVAREDIVGRPVSEVFPGVKEFGLFNVFQRVWRTGVAEKHPISLYKDEHIVGWRENYINKLPSGEVVAVYEDLTERKQAEEALQVNMEKFKKLFDNSPIGKSFTSPDGTINVNRAFCEILGYTKEELSHLKWQDLTHPEDIELSHKNLEPLYSGKEKSARFYKRYIKKDGSIVWADVHTVLQKDIDDTPLYFITAVMDITERKKAEEEIQRLSRFPTENPNPMLRIERNGNILFANQASAPVLTAWGREIGQNLPDDWLGYITTVFESGKNKEIEINCQGQIFSCILAPILDQGYLNIYGRDITERIRAEAEIRRLNAELEDRVAKRTDQLEAANKELEAFSYSVSHDLRAPLRHINGYAKLLSNQFQTELSDKGQHYLDTITDSARHMGVLIDDLLEFSRTGRMELCISTVNMNRIVEDVKEQMSQENPERTIAWTIAQLPSVQGDSAMMELVWMNLLSNAVKFTRNRKKANIEVGFREENQEFVFYVRDNGVGFDMQYAQKLFGVFQRLHTTEEFEGTGIGLANVHRIIFRHRGRTWVEAKLNKGATFYFSIPKYKEDL